MLQEKTMALFRAFRGPYGFSYYDSLRSEVSVDKTFVSVIYMCGLLYVAAIFATLGSRRKSRFKSFFALTFNFTVIMIILVCLCGHSWKEGFVNAQTTYIDYSEEKIDAKIGLSFSLASVNMTLKGEISQNSTVYYNEQLFLFDADELQIQRGHKFQLGLPSPILTLTDYICFEGSDLMWGKYLRTAGYYAYILLCSTLTFWIITVILMCSVVFYGSVMFLISGLTMCITAIVYHLLQPPHPIQIPFGEEVLRLSYGWCFYLVLVTGIITSVIGLFFVALNCFDPNRLHCLFGFENEEDTEEMSNADGYNRKNELALNGNVNLGYNAEMKICKSIENQAGEPNLNLVNNSLNKHITYPSSSNMFSTPNSLEKSQDNIQEINDKLRPNGDLSHVVVVNENERL
ncbi:dual oxidase maturation factor 1 isoform X2 [Octopus bimaculoides]|uniref:dual oxidase maturation factor 1 isoform X2 n=1 Tax=Octopus bimaculoides TaxID=37653 RepID=UPI00071C2269|nr:dual oxidase maturation factor 1 isoform X2 [Octopus bimaculoides]|eukprot:XP_014789288.1 PREDICTED: dual oxidase maturation factor 1-like isoform X2 [Octopus bimaculoides]